jgi:hypothetical protein
LCYSRLPTGIPLSYSICTRIIRNESGTWKYRFTHIGEHFDREESVQNPMEETAAILNEELVETARQTNQVEDMDLQVALLRQQIMDLRQNQPQKREQDNSMNESRQGELWTPQETLDLVHLVMKYGKEKVIHIMDWI